MKTIALYLLVVLLPFAAMCQDTAAKKSATKIEAIQSRVGSVIKKEFIPIGKFQNVTIEALKVTDVASGKVVKGIKFSMYSGGAFTVSGKFESFLDEEEIDPVVKFFTYVKGFTETTENYTEYDLPTEDLSVFAYTGNKKWTCGLQLDKYKSASIASFNVKDVDDLLAYIDMAKGKLQ